MKRRKQTKGGARKRPRIRDHHAMLCAYNEWLFNERRLLALEMYPDHPEPERFVPANSGAYRFHFGRKKNPPPPSTRAAKVLSFVGMSLPGIERDSVHGQARKRAAAEP